MATLGELRQATTATLTPIPLDSRPRHTTTLTITPTGGFIFTEQKSTHAAVVTQQLQAQGKASSSTMIDLNGVFKKEQGISPKDFSPLIRELGYLYRQPTSDAERIDMRRKMTARVDGMMIAWTKSMTRGPILRSPTVAVGILGAMAAGTTCYHISAMKQERSAI